MPAKHQAMTAAKENPRQLATAGGSNEAAADTNQTHMDDSVGHPIDSQVINYTLFVDVTAKTLRRISCRWDELVERVKNPPLHDSKEQCQLINGASFGDRKSASGSYRHRDNVLLVSFLEVDYDGEIISLDAAEAMVRDMGIAAVIYTTARHRHDRPRWRALLPLSNPVPIAERARCVALANDLFQGALAVESFTPSQAYYVGRVKNVLYETREVKGEPIDTCLFATERYPRALSTRSFVDKLGDGLESLPEAVSDETVADLQFAVAALKTGRSDNYAECIQVLQNLKHLAACGRPDAAERLARAHCERSAKFTPEWFDLKWLRQLHPWRGSYRMIFTLAQQDGWTNPRKTLDANAAIERLAKLSIPVIRSTWAAVAAAMDPVDAEEVKAAVHRLAGIPLRALNAALKAARLNRKREYVEQAAGERLVISHRPHDSAIQTREAEERIIRDASTKDLFVFAGRPSRMTEGVLDFAFRLGTDDERPDPVPLIEPHDDVSIRVLAEAHVVFQNEGTKGPVNIAIPPNTISMLRSMPSAAVPRVSGTLGHPIALPDGSVLTTNGLHAETGLFVYGVGNVAVQPYSEAAARTAWPRLLDAMLAGFEFASKLDQHIAIAGLFTAVQRRLMDSAPGLMIRAPIQSSGKTTLARRIHAVLTGRDMPVLTLSIGDDAEIEKRLLAALLRSPPMLVYDNIPDGMIVNTGGAMNAALTSSVFEGRLLGSTQMLRAPTNTFFVATGNNLRLGKDEVTRWLRTTLAPARARPEERTFQHPNVIAHALSIREQVLRDVVGIVAGFLTSRPALSLDTGTRFDQWEKMVRKPIVWAGGDDVALCFKLNGEDSEHDQALRLLLVDLQAAYGDVSFNAREVAALAGGFHLAGDFANTGRIADALEALGARDVTSTKSVGRVLAACADRPVEVSTETLRLSPRVDRNGVSLYQVQSCGVCGL